jgi:thioredoxin-related protein
MHIFRVNVLFSILLFLSLYSHCLFAERPKLTHLKDARITAQLAQANKLPILIMFGTDHCPYCKMLKEEFLIPILISGDYTDKVIIREAHVSAGSTLIDFSGKTVTISEFILQYGVRLFPTMVFVDSDGKPLVEKIIGITTPSLFGGTLDDHIDRALALTRKKLNPDPR